MISQLARIMDFKYNLFIKNSAEYQGKVLNIFSNKILNLTLSAKAKKDPLGSGNKRRKNRRYLH